MGSDSGAARSAGGRTPHREAGLAVGAIVALGLGNWALTSIAMKGSTNSDAVFSVELLVLTAILCTSLAIAYIGSLSRPLPRERRKTLIQLAFMGLLPLLVLLGSLYAGLPLGISLFVSGSLTTITGAYLSKAHLTWDRTSIRAYAPPPADIIKMILLAVAALVGLWAGMHFLGAATTTDPFPKVLSDIRGGPVTTGSMLLGAPGVLLNSLGWTIWRQRKSTPILIASGVQEGMLVTAILAGIPQVYLLQTSVLLLGALIGPALALLMRGQNRESNAGYLHIGIFIILLIWVPLPLSTGTAVSIDPFFDLVPFIPTIYRMLLTVTMLMLEVGRSILWQVKLPFHRA